MNIIPLTLAGIALATALGAYLGDKIGTLGDIWSGLLRWAGVLLVAVIAVGLVRTYTEKQTAAVAVVLLLLGGEYLARGGDGGSERMSSLLMVLVIGGHHLPEGIAAGMGCLQGDSLSWLVSWGVVVHCIPETMVIMPAMMGAGYGRRWAYGAAALSGAMEMMGVLIGCML